ncbi:MAG: hypothetical protein IPG89_16040 [Bacteroidetes bacterium]|nr:hypothetical protein [Bacteroidota bacterium]
MLQQERIIKKVETAQYIIGVRDDGIIHVFYKEHTELDVKLQLEMLDVYIELCENKPYPFIFEAEEYITVTKEARDNALSLEDKSPLAVSAILVKNLAHKLIADFYLKFNKPRRPYKVFKNFEEGLDWLLKTFKNV